MKGTAIILAVLLLTVSASALRNPAAVYCDTLGYKYVVESTGDGEIGRCTLPNNISVDAWNFLEGKTAQGYSYCTQRGYGMKVVENATRCSRFLLSECAVCVLSDGSEIEVTELMGLTFKESVCGDGVCGFPEDNSTCPQDCPPTKTEECASCHQTTETLLPYFAVGAAIVVAAIIIKKLRKKKK
jgi:putative hemolysin